jgi:hypothetical protein
MRYLCYLINKRKIQVDRNRCFAPSRLFVKVYESRHQYREDQLIYNFDKIVFDLTKWPNKDD